MVAVLIMNCRMIITAVNSTVCASIMYRSKMLPAVISCRTCYGVIISPLSWIVGSSSQARVTVQYLSRLLSPILSPWGHNQREQEEAVLLVWSEYLKDIDGTHVHVRVLWDLKLKFNRIILTDMT